MHNRKNVERKANMNVGGSNGGSKKNRTEGKWRKTRKEKEKKRMGMQTKKDEEM